MGTITSITTFIGKVGNIVGYKKKDGSYGLRAHQPRPRNPRTSSQMAIRVALANLVAFWRALVAYAHPNFANKQERESDYNAFVQSNWGNNVIYLTKKEVINGACVVGPYQITRGSLPPITYTAVSGGKMKTDIALGDLLSVTGECTVRVLAGAILENNGTRFVEGDMVTVYYIEQKTVATLNNLPQVVVKALRIPLDLTDNSLVADLENGDIIGITDGYLSSKSTINGGFAVVHSRFTNGKTIVSTQSLEVNNNILAIYTGNTAMQKAINSYGGANDPFLKPIVNVSSDEPVNP